MFKCLLQPHFILEIATSFDLRYSPPASKVYCMRTAANDQIPTRPDVGRPFSAENETPLLVRNGEKNLLVESMWPGAHDPLLRLSSM